MTLSRWWYLDLAADFPELEIYTGHGWGPKQELGVIELGERVMDHEAHWLFTWIYSLERDRVWAAVAYMYAQVIERLGHVPNDWRPDVEAWDRHGE